MPALHCHLRKVAKLTSYSSFQLVLIGELCTSIKDEKLKYCFKKLFIVGSHIALIPSIPLVTRIRTTICILMKI